MPQKQDTVKPSKFGAKFPFSSAKQNTESEVVAQNILTILGRTGDKFRSLSWEEYKTERLKDGDFTGKEKDYFDEVQHYTVSEDAARCFSDSWKKL